MGMNWGSGRRRRLMAAAGLVLATAACSGSEPGPGADTPGAAVVTPLPNTTLDPPPPPLPDLARQRSLPGAEAMTKHVLALYDRAFATGDGEPFGALADKTCGSCRSVVSAAAQKKKDGYVVVGGRLNATDEVSTWSVPDQEAVVTVDVVQGDYTLRDSSGTLVTKGAGGKRMITAVLRWTPQGWRVHTLKAEVVK